MHPTTYTLLLHLQKITFLHLPSLPPALKEHSRSSRYFRTFAACYTQQ